MTRESHTAAILRDGCLLSHTIRGDGPPIIFIQGVGVSGSGWEPQVDFLAQHFRCLTFDNRGIGLSQPPDSGHLASLTVPQMAGDALALMDAQGWESAHVAGHSMGGLIALEIALQARERVRSLALLCTFARGSIATTLSPAMLWTGLRTRLGTRAMRRRAFLEMTMPPGVPADPVQIGALFGHDLADQPPITMKQLAAIRKHDVTARLPELAGISTLVLSASGDRIAPPFAGHAIAAGIPGARYVEIPGAAHGVTLQEPSEVNALLAEHFVAAERGREIAAY
jgi:pimeloyl-ACP methyl ester carboxylesterase